MSAGRKRRARSPGSAIVDRIARIATRRARLVVGIWVALVVVLASQGKNLDSELGIHPLLINGSEPERAHEIAMREFGNDYTMLVLLRGPEAAVERQGRKLAGRLASMPHALVISPWESGAAVEGLNPRPGVAALLVRTSGEKGDEVDGLLPPFQRRVDETVRSPVRANVAGLPVIASAFREANADAAALGELIAIPVLLLVLLLVFRSVLAAVTPLIVGGAVVAVSRGVLSLLLEVVQLDFFVLGITAMMGLALGVDYSLLVVSRFREEQKHAGLPEAVEATVKATTRSILPAGSALLLAMLVAPLVLPSLFVRSVAIGVGIATVLSMVTAICVVPALLTLLGNHLDRWSLPSRKAPSGQPLLWLRRFGRRPGAVVAILAGMLAFSGLAFNLKSGLITPGLLPSGNYGRIQHEEVERALGPGWLAPTEIIVNGRGSPVTSASRLHAIAAFQRDLEGDPGVVSMAGLARVERGTRKLNGIEGELASQERGLDRLESGLSRVGEGATLSTDGLVKAANGSRGLEAGVGAATKGAVALAGGLQKTSSGSKQLTQGLGRANEGSGELAQGSAEASTGASRIAAGLEKAQENTGELHGSVRLFKNAMRSGDDRLAELHEPLSGAEQQLAAAWQALQRMTVGRGDGEYAAALAAIEEASRRLTGRDPRSGELTDPSYKGVSAGVGRAEGQFGVGLYLADRMDKSGQQATKGLKKLASASARLDGGLRHLADGSQEVSEGIAALDRGGEQLSPALQRLSQGAQRLTGGLGLLATGTGRLADGLGEGAERSQALPRALRRISRGLESGRGGESQFDLLRRRSPGLFQSAYFALAALDGSPPHQRAQLGSLLNLNRGGMSARLLIIPRDEPSSQEARETTERLQVDAEGLARETKTEVVVGGVAPSTIDLNDELRGQAPILRIALALISLLVLIPLLRSVTIPILAALINVLTVSATFGALAVLFNGSLLGGPGYVDATAIPGTVLVIFGLAIDYEVFVFARIREEYVRTGSTEAAIEGGLDRTAHVVTGAAVIMISVFLAFSVAGFIPVRNFGVAQAIAVFVDAFLIRLIVVPAMMRWLGPRCWWMPRWLDRLLPGSSVAPAGAEGRT